MTSTETTVTMPDRDTMFNALRSVDTNPHLCEKFYPLICNDLAGKQKVAIGVVTSVQLALVDYTDGLPGIVAMAMEHQVSSFIKVITPSDIQQEAMDLWENILENKSLT